MASQESSRVCPECQSTSLVLDPTTSEIICANCGIVIETQLEAGPEWRSFAESASSRERAGPPLTPLSSSGGLRTYLTPSMKDAQGKTLRPEDKRKFSRLSSIDSRDEGKARTLRRSFNELRRLASQLELPAPVWDTAAEIFRKASEKDILRGRSSDLLVAASLYLACRQNKIPKTLKDFEEIAPNYSLKELGKAVRILITGINETFEASDPKNLIYRLGSELQLSMRTQILAARLYEKAKEAGITTGKNPASIAASILYAAGILTGERRTQGVIGDTAKVTSVTIRKGYKELKTTIDLNEIYTSTFVP